MSMTETHRELIAMLADRFLPRLVPSATLDAAALAAVPADLEADLRAAGTVPEDEVGAVVNLIVDRLSDRSGLRLPRLQRHRLPWIADPLRDEGWGRDAALAMALWSRLRERLAQARAVDRTALPALILASAALRGGLWRPEALAALARALAGGGPRLGLAERFRALPFAELVLAVPGQDRTNLEDGREILRWFPDVVTLHLLGLWRRGEADPALVPAPARSFEAVLAALDVPALDLTPARFAAAAVVTLEAGAGLRLPTAIAAVASGEVRGFSVHADGWRALCRGPTAAPAPGTLHDPWPERRPTRKRRVPEARSDLQVRLEDLLRQHRANSSRRGTAALEAGLKALAEEAAGDWPVLDALISWYRALLRAGDKPRTVADYHSIAGRKLILALGATDPADLTPAELGALLEQARALSGYRSKDQPWGRICHFARHAHRILDWPEAGLAEAGDERSPRFVRTAVLGWEGLRSAVAAIRADPGLPAPMRDTYAAALLVLACGGLRIDEAEGLLVDDALDDLALYVHCTPRHGLKREASRRLVPLGLFLPPDLREVVEAVVRGRRRARLPDGSPEPLLGQDSLFPQLRFQPAIMRALLRQTLGRMLELPVTPHDLRHGLLSSLHLLLYLGEAGAGLVENLTGWSASRQREIRQGLLGHVPHPGRAPLALAAIAGHEDFSPTALNTYCHLADLALGHLILTSPERRRPGACWASTPAPLCP